ncbi:MAG TPA: ABC transporter substrate-binding protein [Acidimicrobiales bacterium]|jgi:ABC-type branched-subunit amino acid transport system substrate-binding protein|nr:ABC transporter substrate-binding protein [Acidimicrobiales bacterium]
MPVLGPVLGRVAGRALGALVAAALALTLPACGRGGPSAAPGFDGRTLRLGVLTPLQGPVAVVGRPLTTGGQLYFDWLNDERGGIAGRYRVELVVEDTGYQADTALAKYQKIKGSVVMFEQALGTGIVKALLPQLDRDGIVAAPASLDADWVRQRHLLALGAPYQVQFANGLHHYATSPEGRGRRVCFAGVANPYGDAGLDGLESAARTLGIPVAATARYNQGDTSFTGVVSQLQDASCDAVFLATFSGDTSRLIGEAESRRFTPRFVVQATGWDPALASGPLAEVMARSVWVIGEGTEWGDRSVKGQADLLERLARYRPDQPPDYYLVFGYYQAWAVAQVLERAAARDDFSRAGIVRAMEEVGTLRFDGLSGDYRYGPPGERVPPRASTIFSVDPSRPLGLAALAVNLETDAARRYDFP